MNESVTNEPKELPSDRPELQEGDVVDALVLATGDGFVDLRLGEREARMAVRRDATLKSGEHASVFVEQLEPKLVVSHEKAEALRLWDELEEAARTGAVVEGTVVAEVRGGLSVDVGTKAFLPASQVDVRPLRDLTAFVGQRLSFKVIRFGSKRGNVVLSRRALVAEERDRQKQAVLSTLAVGDVRKGTVKSFTNYGAFVDLGGLDGLLHVTDMSWTRLTHPGQLLKVGEEVTVKVLKIEAEQGRISLGVRQLTADPWVVVPERFRVGTDFTGKVARVADFGAFVELAPGIEGLVHVSQMTWQRNQRPSDLVRAGDEVRVRVLKVEMEERRIALGMKQLMESPWRAFLQAHPVGSQVTGRIQSLTDFGIFVRVTDELDGLVHLSDFSWTERVKHPSDRYQKGDEVTAVVLDVDVDNERIALGVKQLGEDPWALLAKRLHRGSKVTGKVTRIVDFGAFIEIEPGIEGLCHISQLADERVEKVSDVLKEGDTVEVAVLELDKRDHKISLSRKAVDEGAGESFEEPAAEETTFTNTTLADKLAKSLGKK